MFNISLQRSHGSCAVLWIRIRSAPEHIGTGIELFEIRTRLFDIMLCTDFIVPSEEHSFASKILYRAAVTVERNIGMLNNVICT
jgi:hypothetical protein